ncbi:MAG: hypothetical protein O3A14_12680 [Cyanobacteria bacterium]|nr:hypothetical protein [Cyanobacteriota bacterium]
MGLKTCPGLNLRLNKRLGLSNSGGYRPHAGDLPMARLTQLLGFALCSALGDKSRECHTTSAF